MTVRLNADLAKLNAMTDDEIAVVARRAWVKKIARDLMVPLDVAEARLAGMNPTEKPYDRTET